MIRFNRTISLLICGAAFGAMMPSSPVSATVTELETKEGCIYDAKAFINGMYVYDGYKKDEQDNGTYFSTPKGDLLIEDVSGVGQRYGMNYINFKNDDVLFNLATGQAEEDTEESKRDIIESKFISKVLKKAERYEDNNGFEITKKIAEDCFSSVWYEGKVEGADRDYIVYLNDDGKYIDSSEILNIVYYDKDGKKIEINDYDDLKKYNDQLENEVEKLEILNETTLLLDTDSIYKAVVMLDNSKIKKEMLPVLGQLDDQKKMGYLIKEGAATVYAQKISMEQGKKKDEAYLPKKVETYEAYDLDILGLLANPNNTARIIGNSVYAIQPDYSGNKITIEKYNMKIKKDKKTFDNKTVSRKVLEKDKDFDIENEHMNDFCVDTYGNMWILSKGKVQKIVNGTLETMYKVDRSMDKLSVFDEKSMIIWSEENGIYSTVGQAVPVNTESEVNNKEEVKDENETVSKSENETSIQTGWVKNNDGSWSYKNLDGTNALGWFKDNNKWYYSNSNGIMVTGWLKDGLDWYYLNQSGDMKTGWFNDVDGKWYYLNENGKMAYDTVIDGYKLDSNGEWINK